MGLPVGVVFGSPMTVKPGENPTQFMARVRDQVVAMHDRALAPYPRSQAFPTEEEEEVTDVKHMKWWGWGNEGVGFHWEDKPGFADFVQYAVGLDLHTAKPVGMPSFDKMTIPKSLAGKPLLSALATIVGEGHVTTDDMERVVHVYGKSLRDLVRIRANQVQRYPDVVVYPADEAEVQKIVDAAVAADVVIIPFGGGSNIAGSLEPRADEKRVILSLDMGRLRKVIEIDEESGLARIEAGAQGPDLEEQLNAKGWTIGHFPDSFTHSTLGGWVATRSSGMQSDKYGDISEIARGLRVVRPGGTLVVSPHPSASNGPSVKEMILGSEGRLGVITEVTAQVHRIPAKRDVYAYFFPNWDAGIAAMQEIAESDAAPSITRISDGPETGFSLATSKERNGLRQVRRRHRAAHAHEGQGLEGHGGQHLPLVHRLRGRPTSTPSARRSWSTRSSPSTTASASAPGRACSTTRRSSTPRTCATSCSTGAPRATCRRPPCRGRR